MRTKIYENVNYSTYHTVVRCLCERSGPTSGVHGSTIGVIGSANGTIDTNIADHWLPTMQTP